MHLLLYIKNYGKWNSKQKQLVQAETFFAFNIIVAQVHGNGET